MTDAELVATLLAVKHEKTQAAAAHMLGIQPRQLRERLSEAKAKGLTTESKLITQEAKMRLQMATLKAENRSLLRALEEEERTRAAILGLDDLNPEPPAWLQSERIIDAPGTPMTIWSDWHWGERVFRDQVGGVNQFNRRIAKERVRNLVEKTIRLTMDYMVKPEYPGFVVCLGGDMITGGIHEELRETNEGTVQQCLLEVEEHLIAGLSRMADVFGHVFVPCVVGNHGRDTLKPRAKHRAYTSHEWLMYRRLARHFQGDKRLLFQVPDETDAYFKVYGHRFLLTHGDALGVKGGDGIIGALGPITRGTIKVGRSEAQIGRDFDTLIMGHWHTYIPRSDAVHVIVNGALKGYDEYARVGLRVPYSRPSQALWFVHPAYGITCQWPIFLDAQRRSTQTARWVSFEQQRSDQ